MSDQTEDQTKEKIVLGVTEKKIGNVTYVITKTQSPNAKKTLEEKMMSYLLRSD